ncbi:hypothetical protein DFH07DRAFT_781275 [Mycena maculata]|uniref:Uncharacterized protein n=1 Tax=Mycena maculata TaxID=230809 RepID=A0AAD7HZA4_9AGAR|nr:hypothetical protein DFH07DRAFT_781275 [Mycena maculata]
MTQRGSPPPAEAPTPEPLPEPVPMLALRPLPDPPRWVSVLVLEEAGTEHMAVDVPSTEMGSLLPVRVRRHDPEAGGPPIRARKNPTLVPASATTGVGGFNTYCGSVFPVIPVPSLPSIPSVIAVPRLDLRVLTSARGSRRTPLTNPPRFRPCSVIHWYPISALGTSTAMSCFAPSRSSRYTLKNGSWVGTTAYRARSNAREFVSCCTCAARDGGTGRGLSPSNGPLLGGGRAPGYLQTSSGSSADGQRIIGGRAADRRRIVRRRNFGGPEISGFGLHFSFG